MAISGKRSYGLNVYKGREKKYMREWHAMNPGKANEYSDEWAKRNPEYARDKLRTRQKLYGERHRERLRLRGRAWAKNNPAYCAEKSAYRRAMQGQATPAWVDRKAIRLFYLFCPRDYQVDHIIPLISKTVCGLHCEANLQYLKAKDNKVKRNGYIG